MLFVLIMAVIVESGPIPPRFGDVMRVKGCGS